MGYLSAFWVLPALITGPLCLVFGATFAVLGGRARRRERALRGDTASVEGTVVKRVLLQGHRAQVVVEYPGVNGVGTRLSQLVHDHEGTLSPGSRVIVRVGAAMRGAAVIEGVERGDPAWNQLGVFLAVGMLATLVGVIEAAG